MIVLHTLGDALILVGDRKVRPSSPLVFASLLYLAMERGRRVPRAALQELLFPDSDERSGSHSLRQLLYKLRQLGAPLESDATSVALPADRVRDDLSVNGATDAATVSFLPEYEPRISERFSEWLERKRAEVAKDVRVKLASAIEAHREALNWSAVERDAQLLLSVDPFNEIGTFALAEAVALSGRKAAAIKILSDYEKETGRTDLRLPASLLRRRIAHAVPEPVATLAALPFVGRDAEVKELRKYIARARAGQPCMYVIGGEAGIGKTRLLTETAALAALEGVSVFTVRCQAHYASRPLSVFIELVPALFAARGALGISPQSLASLNSLTSHTDVHSERPPDSRDDLTRSELLLAAIRDLVDAVAHEQPLLIGVEDAHWADHNSLNALRRLVHCEGERALAVACTTRTPDLFPHSASVDDRTVVRRLKPLTSEVMGQLAERLLPVSLPGPNISDLIEWSVRTAAGNPLYLQMLCSHYTATGEADAVSSDVFDAVIRRVQEIPESGRRLLAICALLGKHATVSALRDLTESGHLQLLETVQRLEEQGYISVVNDRLCIAHDLLTQAVLSLVPPASTRVLHACVASALESRYDTASDADLLWDCAEQWVLSGDATKAIEFLTKCARHAIQIGRAAEAIDLLTRSRQIARRHSDTWRVEGELVLAARAVARWDIAAESFARWSSTNRHDGRSDHESLIEFVGLEATWFAKGDVLQLIPKAQKFCRESTNSFTRVEAARLLLAMAHDQCDAALAEEAYESAKPFLDGNSGEHANRFLPVHYHSVFGDRDVALDLLTRMIKEIDLFDCRDRIRTASNAAVAYAFVGEHRKAYELGMVYFAQAERLGAMAQAHFLLAQAVTALVTLECIDAAYQLHKRAGASAMKLGGIHDTVHLANDAELALARGNAVEARQAWEKLANLDVRTPRLSAYVGGLQARISQLDPTFVLDPRSVNALLALHRKSARFVSADGLTLAIAEDLRRRGASQEATAFAADYVTHERRERGLVPTALKTFLRRPSGDDRRAEPALALGGDLRLGSLQ